jgi:hypothetical protein
MGCETSDNILPPSDLLPGIRAAEEHKIVQGLESIRQGKGLDGEAVMAELLTELDASE